jgi:hypothetical protein
MSKIQSMQEYFENYRQLLAKRQELSGSIAEKSLQLHEQRTRLYEMDRNVLSMRKVITEMVEKDLDPVEVAMRNDIGEMTGNLWSERDTECVMLDDGMVPDLGTFDSAGLLNTGPRYQLGTSSFTANDVTTRSEIPWKHLPRGPDVI